MGELILLRHGETGWSLAGRHTGRTDIPLTSRGEECAKVLAPILARRHIVAVFTSPAQRAGRTAILAGLTEAKPDRDLWEWDYGGYEGLTTPEIRQQRPGWYLWQDGVIPGDAGHPGETVEQVGERVDRVLARVTPLLANGDVALVAHGHVLRVLTARYLRLEPAAGRLFRLDTGTLSTLGNEHGEPVILSWNNAVLAPGGRLPGNPAVFSGGTDPRGPRWAGLVAEPGQVRGGAGHDGQGDDLRLVVAVPFGNKGGEIGVAVGGQLEQHEPLLGPLQPVVPPVHGRDRASHLRARG
jgi:broad specificity phosphatase PhoE